MSVFIFYLLFFFIVILDYNRYKTMITPSIILGGGYGFILCLYLIFYERINLKPLYLPSVYIWIFGLFVFWILGYILSYIAYKPKTKKMATVEVLRANLMNLNRKIVVYLSAFALFLCFFLYKAFIIYKSQGSEASELYLSGGLQSHLFVVFNIFAILSVLSISLKKNYRLYFGFNFFIILVAVVYVILYSTKSAILYLFLSFFLARVIYFDKKIHLSQVAFILFFGFLTFFISYSLIFEKLADLDFLLNHMSIYYFSGIGSISSYIQNGFEVGLDPLLLFRPVENFVNFIQGDVLKTTISSEWTYMGGGVYTNVKTFFGTIYLYGGFKWGMLCVIIYSVLVHLIFFQRNRKNFFIIALIARILTLLAFGWFDIIFNTLAFYELIVVSFLLAYIYRRYEV